MRARNLVPIVALGIVLGLNTAPAQAATVPGWTSWLMPTGTVCVQTGTQTWLPLATAAANWNRTDASVVGKVSCAGYPRSMTVITRSYSSSSDGACAKFHSPGWAWQKVRGVWTWVPTAPTILVNQWYRLRAWCQSTYRKRLNLMTHELGHMLGLAHRSGRTVMLPYVNETYVTPQAGDVYLVNRRY